MDFDYKIYVLNNQIIHNYLQFYVLFFHNYYKYNGFTTIIHWLKWVI